MGDGGRLHPMPHAQELTTPAKLHNTTSDPFLRVATKRLGEKYIFRKNGVHGLQIAVQSGEHHVQNSLEVKMFFQK
jgi:hypothetical protein